MGETAAVPQDGHLITVKRYGYGYVVSHTSNNKLCYTATYDNRMDALRSAERVSDNLRADGADVYMQVDPNVHFN
jgi:hypothetical protein